MPKIATFKREADPIKLLLIGDSGAGKTGSLASLATAGYNLRVLDLDKGIPILLNYLGDPESDYVKRSPDVAERLHWITLSDKMKNVGGEIIPVRGDAWPKALSMLNSWKVVEDDVDFGPITSWTERDVLVIDSLTMLSTAAHNYFLAMNGLLAKKQTQNEARRNIFQVQDLLRKLLQMLYDSSVKCNVILTSHITFISETGRRPDAEEDKEQRDSIIINGYPSAIGRALSPHIPRYFNTVLIARPIGSGPATRHKIFTNTTEVGGQLVNAKNQAPLKVKPSYDLKDGLAQFFEDVKR